MTNLNSSTSPSTADSHSPETSNRVVRKRNRIPLSCAPCRSKKLKCNRGHPCENCVKKGDAAQCTYAMAGPRRRNTTGQQQLSSGDMQKRIDRLEGLVLSLMANGAKEEDLHTPPTTDASNSLSPSESQNDNYDKDMDGDDTEEEEEDEEIEKIRNSMVLMKMHSDSKTSFYLGETHWATILSDIAEVKSYMAQHHNELVEQQQKFEAKEAAASGGLGVFPFNGVANVTKSELLAVLPPRPTVDVLIKRYFNAFEPGAHILHVPTFWREYEEFWRDPSKSSIIWLGLLFVLMNLSLTSYAQFGDEPPSISGDPTELANSYFKRSEQCLLLTDFSKPGKYVLETMVLHLKVQHHNRSPELGMWVAVGNIVRIAMRMGYHRDSKSFPDISPFEGEMRRRVWTFIHCMDLMSSTIMGLPSMIRDGDSDTALPSNIDDDQFDQDSTELPPSRPELEYTGITYMIHKAQLCFAVGEVVETLNSLKPTSYDEVMRLDAKLRKVRDDLPELLKFKPLTSTSTDSAILIVQRYGLDVLYQKAMCILHRRFVSFAKRTDRYVYSVQACVDASLVLLQHQATLRIKTGSRLRGVNWFITSIATHDFLLAAMIVALCLHALHSNAKFGSCMNRMPSVKRERDAMVAALENANSIYYEMREQSLEAFKVNKILNVMLQTIKKMNDSFVDDLSMPLPSCSDNPRSPNTASHKARSTSLFSSDSSTSGTSGASRSDRPEHSAAMTLNLLSSGMSPKPSASPSPFDISSPSKPQVFSPETSFWTQYLPDATDNTMMDMNPGFNGMSSFENGQNLDWGAFDTFVSANNPLDTFSNQFWNQQNVDFQLLDQADTIDPQPQAPLQNAPAQEDRSYGNFGAL